MEISDEQNALSRLRDLEEELAAVAEDDPTRPVHLDAVACAIADYHCESGAKDVGDLPRAIKLAEEAYNTSSEGSFENPTLVGRFENTLMELYWRKYQNTADPEDILASEKYGHLAVKNLPSDVDPGLISFLGTRRKALLARTLKSKHEDEKIGGDIKDLHGSLSLMGDAADSSLPGDPEGCERFTTFCDLLAYLTDLTGDEKYLDGAIALRTKQLDEPVSDLPRSIASNGIGLVWLLIKKYQSSENDDNLQKLFSTAKQIFFNEPQSDDDKHSIWQTILRVAERKSIPEPAPNPSPKSPLYLSTLKTALFIHDAALEQFPPDSRENIQQRSYVFAQAGEIADRKWQATREPEDGFRANDLDAQSALHNAKMQYLNSDLDNKVESLEQAKYCTFYICRVTGEEVTVGPGESVTRKPRSPALDQVAN